MKRKLNVFLSLLLFLCLSTSSHEGNEEKQSLEEKYKDLFAKVFQKIRGDYVDKIDEKKILEDGIRGLTKSLDPYSKPLVGNKKKYYENLSKGGYGGVGMHLSKIKDKLTIIAVFPKTPAEKSQLISGDQITHIEGKETKDLSLKDCSEHLKGDPASKVKITVYRPYTEETLEKTLTREKIRLYNLSYTDLVEGNNLYIEIKKFSKNISAEFHKALQEVDLETLNSIIIDLRGNTGGLLSSSLKILDEIFQKNTTILKLQGRNREKTKPQKTKNQSYIPAKIKIVTLIDHSSASASEIVAGALQDLDRGVIVGEASFGKGLVQKIYTISPEMNLKLTTARYQTPSGRLIQKKKYGDNDPSQEEKEFTTLLGRKVTSGGGISPDIKAENDMMPSYIKSLDRNNLFLTFAASYKNLYEMTFPLSITGKIREDFKLFLKDYELSYDLPGEKSLRDLKKNLEFLKETYKSEKLSILDEKILAMDKVYSDLKEDPGSQEINQTWIERRLKEKFSYVLKGEKEENRQNLAYDKVFQRALELVRSEKEYADILRPRPNLEKPKEKK